MSLTFNTLLNYTFAGHAGKIVRSHHQYSNLGPSADVTLISQPWDFWKNEQETGNNFFKFLTKWIKDTAGNNAFRKNS